MDYGLVSPGFKGGVTTLGRMSLWRHPKDTILGTIIFCCIGFSDQGKDGGATGNPENHWRTRCGAMGTKRRWPRTPGKKETSLFAEKFEKKQKSLSTQDAEAVPKKVEHLNSSHHKDGKGGFVRFNRSLKKGGGGKGLLRGNP